MSHFNYNRVTGKFSVAKRPGNQSTPVVTRKIAARLERLILANQNIELTDLQVLFVEEVKGNKKPNLQINQIDIAHNIAISAIMDAMVDRMNNPLAQKDITAEAFVDDLVSSDDDEAKVKVKQFFDSLRSPVISWQEKLSQANTVARRLNGASKNLMPGYSSPNRSIGNNRDPHLVLNNHSFQETDNSIRLSKSADAFFNKPYRPKSRTTQKGNVEFQSSSVDEDANTSYYIPKK